jgi:hypothetical protein
MVCLPCPMLWEVKEKRMHLANENEPECDILNTP